MKNEVQVSGSEEAGARSENVAYRQAQADWGRSRGREPVPDDVDVAPVACAPHAAQVQDS